MKKLKIFFSFFLFFCLLAECQTERMALSSESLIVVAKEFLELSVPWNPGHFECQFLGGIEKEIFIPRPEKSMQIIPRFPSSPSYKGRSIVEVSITVDGYPARVLSLLFYIRIFQTVFLTKHFISRRTPLSEKHFYTRLIETTNIASATVCSMQEILGKQNKNSLKANHILVQEDLEEIPLVVPGNIVTLVLEEEFLKITVLARALDSGKKGDWIRVVNLSSQKILKAKIMSESMVSIMRMEEQHEKK